MTTIARQVVACGHCHARNTIEVPASTHRFGSMDLDLRPPAEERHLLAYDIHQCTQCGYCAPELRTEEKDLKDVLASARFRDILADEGLPEVARRFTAFACLAEHEGNLSQAVWAYVHAAWACDDSPGKDSLAIVSRRRALQVIDEMHGRNEWLIGEAGSDWLVMLDLLRRCGRYDEVRVLAKRVRNTLAPNHRAICVFQERLALLGDSGCHDVAQVQRIEPGGLSIH